MNLTSKLLASICCVAFSCAAFALDAKIKVLRDIAYGPDSAQRIDVYLPDPPPTNAPIIAMVHGGAWVFGDKSNRQVVENKANRWVRQGIVFVSINNRLVPAAAPVQQAEDVARALAMIQRDAKSWGADPTKVVLMGHSAGAHLVAFLSADPARAKRLGAERWLGTVALDSGALDVPTIMNHPHARLYDRAFGADSAAWKHASPFHALTREATPMLSVCSTRRSDSCPQSRAFAAAASKLGVKVEVLGENLSHREINETLGQEGDYTKRVETYMASLDEGIAKAFGVKPAMTASSRY